MGDMNEHRKKEAVGLVGIVSSMVAGDKDELFLF